MKKADWHTYQILTKRAERMHDLLSNPKAQSLLSPFPHHIWLGVSVERNDYVDRIAILKKVKCSNRFISFEPLIGPVKNLSRILSGIEWVIVGGESGSNARPMEREWVEDIYQACSSKGIPFFFKQWGEFDELGKRAGKKLAGRTYKGRIWDQFPIGQGALPYQSPEFGRQL
jgi:protein gp37